MAQGRLRVEAMKPQQCPSKTTQTLESMRQHLFTLRMHTYKVQEGITVTLQALWQASLVLHRMEPTKQVPHREPRPAVSSQLFGLRVLGAQSRSSRQGLSYSGERVPLARRGACRRESLDATTRWRTLESTLCCALSRCPFYVIFSSRVFPSDVI
jgi:hypothetical protein